MCSAEDNNCNSNNMTPLSATNANRSQSISTQSKSLIRKTSSKEKRLVRRSSSKKDKENGHELLISKSDAKNYSLPIKKVIESECTECDIRQMNVTFTYKPRIQRPAFLPLLTHASQIIIGPLLVEIYASKLYFTTLLTF